MTFKWRAWLLSLYIYGALDPIILTIAALLAFKLRSENTKFPQTLTLPDGTKPVAFTQTKDWYSIITDANEILIYKNDGTLIKSIIVQDLE